MPAKNKYFTCVSSLNVNEQLKGIHMIALLLCRYGMIHNQKLTQCNGSQVDNYTMVSYISASLGRPVNG